jgi:predicted tellurium resistance membrane protein TerC
MLDSIFQSRAIVRYNSSLWFYVISFVGFIGAILLMPQTTELVAKYVPPENQWLHLGTVYFVSYLLAVVILPEIGCWIYRSTQSE